MVFIASFFCVKLVVSSGKVPEGTSKGAMSQTSWDTARRRLSTAVSVRRENLINSH